MKQKIGINPISWSNDDLQHVGGDISLQTCLSEAAAAGFQGVELGHKFPRDATRLRPLLEEHGLKLVSGWYSGQLLQRSSRDEIAAMQAHAALLRDMGCEVLIFAEVTGCIHSTPGVRLSQRPRLAAGQWREFGKRLSDVAGHASEYGLKLCYHHHMGTVVQSAADIKDLMDNTSDEVFLLLDSGHATFAGADPVRLAGQYAHRIGHVHCKDIRLPVLKRSLNRDASFLESVLDGVFTVPGDGHIDFPGIFAVLAGLGYAGWYVVEAEQDPSVALPSRYAALGHQNLSSSLDRAYAA